MDVVSPLQALEASLQQRIGDQDWAAALHLAEELELEAEVGDERRSVSAIIVSFEMILLVGAVCIGSS